MSTTELLPCPFCGGKASTDARPGSIIGRVYCRNDECFGPMTTSCTLQASIVQWNARPGAHAQQTSQSHSCLTCCGDGKVSSDHSHLKHETCPHCNGTGRGPADDPADTFDPSEWEKIIESRRIGLAQLIGEPVAGREICFGYTNYRGERAFRRATPISVRFGISEYHADPQWLMLAFDTEKNAEREFAMIDMTGVVPPGLPVLPAPSNPIARMPEREAIAKTVFEAGLYLDDEDSARSWADLLERIDASDNTAWKAELIAHREYVYKIADAILTLSAQPAPEAGEVENAHYLRAIRVKLERLYEMSPNNASLREQISDEFDRRGTHLAQPDSLLAQIKQTALVAGAPGEMPVPRALAHIVRLCIDGGAPALTVNETAPRKDG